MKELSIEQKAKAYDEAIKRMKCLLHDSGAIFGGVVREPQISIIITVMDVFGQENYRESWCLYQFYSANKNNERLSEFKKTVYQFVKDFDKEWNRRRENYIKRHGKDCV